MSRRGLLSSDTPRVFNIAVVGLSGTEKEKGQLGAGKSCLCNRFVRPKADDYFPEHISVLSVTDFSGRVVNNDHFLYWGYCTKAMEDSPEIAFNVIEQTEFMDDATFSAFKGGKMEPYVRRCCSTRIYSAEKLMYICKSQLGIEKEFEQRVLPEGKLFIDGFIVIYDVSAVPGRSIDRQSDFTTAILFNLLRTKKPILIATTKNDEACEAYIKEAEKLTMRKEFKNMQIPIIETSAHENVNVDAAFLVLAQLIDKCKAGRLLRILSYNETARGRKEMLDSVSDSFGSLIQSNVKDHRSMWVGIRRELGKYPAFQRYIEHFGEDCAQRTFRRHLKRLKDDFITRRERRYLERLPQILKTLFPSLPESEPWENVVQLIKEHPECSVYFAVAPSGLAVETADWTWGSESSDDVKENRIPLDLLGSEEAAQAWSTVINSLHTDRLRSEHRAKFKQLLDNTPYVTPGKSLNELQVLFMGHDCFEALTGQEISTIYEQHQLELIERGKRQFIELLLEHAELFTTNSTSPNATISQQQIREMIEVLQEDGRYRALDRLDQERRIMLLQHIGFLHGAGRCPADGECVDGWVESTLDAMAPKAHYNGQLSTDAALTLYLIGASHTVESIKIALSAILDDEEYELDGIVYTVEATIIIPQNFPANTPNHLQSRIVLYSNGETLEDTKADLEKTLLSNLAEENVPFAEPPVVIVFCWSGASGPNEDRDELSKDGENLATSLGCGFVDVSSADSSGECSTQLLAEALQSLVRSLRERANPSRPMMPGILLQGEPDIRVIMCMFCGDGYNALGLIQPLFTLPACQQTSERAISLLTFLGERRRSVQILLSSYHGACAHREDLVHGLILVYSTTRLASFSALKSFSSNVPNLPIQILAVTDNGGAASLFNSQLGQKLITEGNALADELHGHFTTWSGESSAAGIYSPFFRQVWEQKVDIERAFRMESPLCPPVGSELDPMNDAEDIYEQLQSDDSEEALVRPSQMLARHQQGTDWMGTAPGPPGHLSHFHHKNYFTATAPSERKNNNHSQPPMPLPGRLNISEYSCVTDALSRMRVGGGAGGHYKNLSEEYVSDTGGRRKGRRGRLPPPPSDSSSSPSPTSDPEDNRPRLASKKKPFKNPTRNSRGGGKKSIFTPIPTVPKGFVPYVLTDTRSRGQGIGPEDCGEPPSPLDQKPFSRDSAKKDKNRKTKEKPKKLTKSKSTEQSPPVHFGMTLEEATAPGGILERCIKFIEEEGLDMEGLYRVPGNRAHVETLFSRLAEDGATDLGALDIPVNAVATALKDFLAKRLPPVIPTERMPDVERVSTLQDRSLRLLELKKFLLSLPAPNLRLLRLVFCHLVRVSEKSRINAMDSKNLAICWWPTLLPFSFVDMLRFEQMRPHLEDLVQTMIDQFPFLFQGKEDVVMV